MKKIISLFIGGLLLVNCSSDDNESNDFSELSALLTQEKEKIWTPNTEKEVAEIIEHNKLTEEEAQSCIDGIPAAESKLYFSTDNTGYVETIDSNKDKFTWKIFKEKLIVKYEGNDNSYMWEVKVINNELILTEKVSYECDGSIIKFNLYRFFKKIGN